MVPGLPPQLRMGAGFGAQGLGSRLESCLPISAPAGGGGRRTHRGRPPVCLISPSFSNMFPRMGRWNVGEGAASVFLSCPWCFAGTAGLLIASKRCIFSWGGGGASFPAGISPGEGVNWVGDWGAVPSSGSGDLSCVGEASKQASIRTEVILWERMKNQLLSVDGSGDPEEPQTLSPLRPPFFTSRDELHFCLQLFGGLLLWTVVVVGCCVSTRSPYFIDFLSLSLSGDDIYCFAKGFRIWV